MNKIIRAASVLSIGAATFSLTTAVAADGGTRPLTLSLGLKGFYDDNIYTRPSSSSAKIKSWGFDVTPGIKYDISTGATTASFGYTVDAKYFDKRSKDDAVNNIKSDPWDYAHYVNGRLTHAVNEHVSFEVGDSFSVSREPEQFLTGQVARSKADLTSNRASIAGDIALSDEFKLVPSYKNNLYDYSDIGYKTALNRMEHLPQLDLRYQFAPETAAILGYRYGVVNFDKNLTLFSLLKLVPTAGGVAPSIIAVPSSARDSESHFIYAGVDHRFSPELSASARVGAEFTDYVNASLYSPGSHTTTSPFADANIKYDFAKNSSAVVGVRHQRNPTDAIFPDSTGRFTFDQESTLLYASLGHQFTARLRGTLNGQYQNSSFKGGAIDSQKEDLYGVGIGASYMLTDYLYAEASYFYDKVTSASGTVLALRDYTRNRVFFGIRATY